MRCRFAFALMLVLATGCTPPSGNLAGDNGQSASGGARADAAVTVAAANGNPCTATWNGEAVTTEELSTRTVRLVEQAIERAGGIANMRAELIPRVSLEATPTLTFACVGPAIAAIQQGGGPEIMLKPTGAVQQPVSVYTSLTSSGGQPAQVTIQFGQGDRIGWTEITVAGRTDEMIDLAGVRTRARAFASDHDPRPAGRDHRRGNLLCRSVRIARRSRRDAADPAPSRQHVAARRSADGSAPARSARRQALATLPPVANPAG